jgi:crotonobetainyl-CoA:carnitine CoA-transferase CaiB-like acyl-CoA transferase
VRDASSPLAGLVVLDFTRVLAGPYCTRLLADLGARVIKIERPGDGDEMRRGLLQLEEGREDQSTYFVRCNAGKESVSLDLGHPDAAPIIRDLARVADVAVENFMPGVAAKLGCDYETLAVVRPDLIHCSISGYRADRPLARRPAFAHLIHAASGLMHLEQGKIRNLVRPTAGGGRAGRHSRVRRDPGGTLAPRAHGQGAYVDVSMLETLIAADDLSFGSVLNGGEAYPSPRAGMLVKEIGGRYVALQTVGAAEIWKRLLVDGPARAQHRPALRHPLARRQHWPELRDTIGEWLGRFGTVDEAVEVLTRARVPCAPALSPTEVVALPISRRVASSRRCLIRDTRRASQARRFTSTRARSARVVPRRIESVSTRARCSKASWVIRRRT